MEQQQHQKKSKRKGKGHKDKVHNNELKVESSTTCEEVEDKPKVNGIHVTYNNNNINNNNNTCKKKNTQSVKKNTGGNQCNGGEVDGERLSQQGVAEQSKEDNRLNIEIKNGPHQSSPSQDVEKARCTEAIENGEEVHSPSTTDLGSSQSMISNRIENEEAVLDNGQDTKSGATPTTTQQALTKDKNSLIDISHEPSNSSCSSGLSQDYKRDKCGGNFCASGQVGSSTESPASISVAELTKRLNLTDSPEITTKSDDDGVVGICGASGREIDTDYGICYMSYESEIQMPSIMKLIQKDLSEPYSVYTYRYFIHNWPKLCFLAMDGERMVGAIVCKLDVHKQINKRGYIAMLAVDKDYRRKKIGSNLVLKSIRAMAAEDADEIVLETEVTNKSALKLYENLGFARDKRLFRYYLNGVDALRLKLWLK